MTPAPSHHDESGPQKRAAKPILTQVDRIKSNRIDDVPSGAKTEGRQGMMGKKEETAEKKSAEPRKTRGGKKGAGRQQQSINHHDNTTRYGPEGKRNFQGTAVADVVVVVVVVRKNKHQPSVSARKTLKATTRLIPSPLYIGFLRLYLLLSLSLFGIRLLRYRH